MRSFSVTVQTEVASPQAEAFNCIVPIDLTSIFQGHGLLPAVKGTQNQTGAWDAVGQTRTVILSDGSSAQERLTGYEQPHYFSYTVSEFSGVFRYLTTAANGEWWFQSNPSEEVKQIKWRYALTTKSLLAEPILWLITHALWRGYMQKVIQLCKQQIEQ
jgi:hypothetical protein